jgi:GNAT superfamily N-acetyltransferase
VGRDARGYDLSFPAYDRRVTVLRAAQPGEAGLLADLQERASVAAFGHIFPPEEHPFPRDDVLRRWSEALDDPAARVVVAEDGDPVGVVLVRPGWLEGLYVVPTQWGTGVGAALHDRALELVAAFGSERCQLWVLEQNHRARRFYERRGWRENGETRVVPFPPNPLDVGYTLDF